MTSAHAVHAFLLHLPFGGGSSNTHIQYAAVYMLLLVLGTAVLLPLLASMAFTFFSRKKREREPRDQIGRACTSNWSSVMARATCIACMAV
jgi:hypothetical protein